MVKISFYSESNARPDTAVYATYRPNARSVTSPAKPKKTRGRQGHATIGLLLVVVLGLGLLAGFKIYRTSQPAAQAVSSSTAKASSSPTASKAAVTPAAVNQCAGNNLSQLLLVSIGQRHMWACSGATTVYDSAVVTGMQNLAADLTPTGTYHIYAKETNLYLKGHDSTGSWDDYVNYWMPFLDNQYGAYGFHDATWRAADAFGNISPYSSNASHGCVEMPLAAAKWLYGWAVVGTTVTVES